MNDDDDVAGRAGRPSRLAGLAGVLRETFEPLWTQNLWDPNSPFNQQRAAASGGSNNPALALLPLPGRWRAGTAQGLGGPRFGGSLPVAIAPMPQPPPPEETPGLEFLGRVSNGVQEGADSARDAEPGEKMKAFAPASLTGFLTAGLTAPLMKRLGLGADPVANWPDFLRNKVAEEGVQDVMNKGRGAWRGFIEAVDPSRSPAPPLPRSARPVVGRPVSLPKEERGRQSPQSPEFLALEQGNRQLVDSSAQLDAANEAGIYYGPAFDRYYNKVQDDIAHSKAAQARYAAAEAERAGSLERSRRQWELDAQAQGGQAQTNQAPAVPPQKPSPLGSDYQLWRPTPGAMTIEDIRKITAASNLLGR